MLLAGRRLLTEDTCPPTFQSSFSQQRRPLTGPQLVSAPRLWILLHHVTPGRPQGLSQDRTDARESRQLDGGTGAVDGAVVSGQGGRRKDLQTGAEDRMERQAGPRQGSPGPRRTFWSCGGRWASVKPSRIRPGYRWSRLRPATGQQQLNAGSEQTGALL